MIAHIDADAFFASVLQRKNPELRGKPLLALGMGGTSVIAASYEAKAKGVKTGMPYREAIHLCPEALSVPSDFRETALASEQIENILRDHCPIIEQMSIDEWFLDLRTLPGGLPSDLPLWARTIRQQILRMTGLSVSVGVAPTKLLAKMASEYRKPAGLTIVTHTSHLMRGHGTTSSMAPHAPATVITIKEFLHDRPAEAIPGIGRRRSIHTRARDWLTAWDIAAADREAVSKLFGKNGRDMQRELLGERVAPLVGEPLPPKSVSRCRSFKAVNDPEQVWAHLLRHLSYLTLKMRRHNLACRGVSAWVRDRQYRYWSAHSTSQMPLSTEESILPFLQRCFQDIKTNTLSFTQAGAGLWHLNPEGSTQFSLFRPPQEAIEEKNLQESLDTIRGKYGRDVIGRGTSLSAASRQKPGMPLSFVD